MGNARIVIVTCISYYLLRRNSVLAMSERMHDWCLSLERWNEPPCLATICLASLWYMIPSCPGSLRARMSCCPIHRI